MSTKLPWTRLFADKWLLDLACLPAIEGNVYMRLRLQMLRTREPLVNDAQILSHFTCCSVKRFQKALDYLFRSGHIVLSEDGYLWCPDVEEELKNSDETLNKFAERAAKAANTRKHKNQEDSLRKPQDSLRSLEDSSRCLQDSSRGYNNNNINIYKKNKTNVLLKKEIDFEDLETIDLVDEPIECDVESQSEQTNQPPIHEQTSVPKKAKRSKGKKELGSVPEDFEPDLQYAIDKGLTHDEALLEFERFKLHWKANPYRNANNRDWQSAWCGWIINQNGTLAKKLEQEKRYANERYKLSTNNFTNSLSQSFSTLKAAITTSDSYGSECIRDTEAISSFASTFQESGSECVSSNLYAWKAIDTGGEIASFARL
ncbi:MULTISPECIES: hypothetical protein [unclassified Bartonella]|uniref:hypothetical protein n=2 Tax=Bartonella TaxID=773 RepID=UPI0023620B07|nr:hypothetical protein [Bartonella sp. CM31XJBT]